MTNWQFWILIITVIGAAAFICSTITDRMNNAIRQLAENREVLEKAVESLYAIKEHAHGIRSTANWFAERRFGA